jgi:hypothetical protein
VDEFCYGQEDEMTDRREGADTEWTAERVRAVLTDPTCLEDDAWAMTDEEAVDTFMQIVAQIVKRLTAEDEVEAASQTKSEPAGTPFAAPGPV